MIALMNIEADAEGVLKERMNKFLGIASIVSPPLESEMVHIHDPGRLEDTLYKGNKILLKREHGKNRKTKWDVIAGYDVRNKCWIPVHSGYHSMIAEKILGNEKINPFGKIDRIKSEVKHGESRLDFLVTDGEKRTWIEVKGCTSSRGEMALFPDAPTKRGTRHLNGLMDAVRKGDGAAVLFLIFRRDAKRFSPDGEIDPEFAKTFHDAINTGVKIHAFRLIYEKGKIYFDKEIPICDSDKKSA